MPKKNPILSRVLNALLSNEFLLAEAKKKTGIRNLGSLKSALEGEFNIAIVLYFNGGRIEINASSLGEAKKSLVNTVTQIILKNPLLKEYFEAKYKDYVAVLRGYVGKRALDIRAKHFFYTIDYERGKLIIELLPLFRDIFKKLIAEFTIYDLSMEELKEKIEKQQKIVRESLAQEKKEEKPKEEKVEEKIVKEKKEEVTVKEKEEKREEEKPKEEVKPTRTSEYISDIYDIFMKFIDVYVAIETEYKDIKIPLIKYLRHKAEGFPKEDIFFLYFNIDKMLDWLAKTKVYRTIDIYREMEETMKKAELEKLKEELLNLSEEERDKRLKETEEEVAKKVAKEYLLQRLAYLFRSEENNYLVLISMALNKILEKLRDIVDKTGEFRGVPLYEFVKRVLSDPQINERRIIIESVFKNLNFVYILPYEIAIKAKYYSDLEVRTSGHYTLESKDYVLESHQIYFCHNCNRFFAEKPRNKKKPRKAEEEEEKRLCVFCGSEKTEELTPDKVYKPRFAAYIKTEGELEKFIVFDPVAQALGNLIDTENTPLIIVPYHETERVRASPLERVLGVVIALVDKQMSGIEDATPEMAEEALFKLEIVKKPIEKLRLLAKSLNAFGRSRVLYYVDYAIIAHLIALATASNKKIIYRIDEDIITDEDRNFKPSINFINIGESGAAKSSLKEKMVSIFPDKVIGVSLYRFTARQITGYVSQYKPRKSILVSYDNKLLLLDEATYAREEDVFAVLRGALESGTLDDGTRVNVAFGFIMNDPLNVNIGSVKGLKGFREAVNLASEILRHFGETKNILTGLYSYMILALIERAFTKAFLERMRMFIISREYSKVYVDPLKVQRKYLSELRELKERDILLTLPELRAYILHKVLPINTIIVTEPALDRAMKYGRYFSTIFLKIGEKLDELTQNQSLFVKQLDLTVDRIANSLILIASGIAKLLRPQDAYKEGNNIVIEITEEDVELAKYFYITFAPDYLHEIAMKQLDEIFKHLRLIEEQQGMNGLLNVDFEQLYSIVSQSGTVSEYSELQSIEVRPDISKVKVTIDDMVEIMIKSIKDSFNLQKPFFEVFESAVRAIVGTITDDDLTKLYERAREILNYLQKQNLITMYQDKIIEITDPSQVLSKKKMRQHILVIENSKNIRRGI